MIHHDQKMDHLDYKAVPFFLKHVPAITVTDIKRTINNFIQNRNLQYSTSDLKLMVVWNVFEGKY